MPNEYTIHPTIFLVATTQKGAETDAQKILEKVFMLDEVLAVVSGPPSEVEVESAP